MAENVEEAIQQRVQAIQHLASEQEREGQKLKQGFLDGKKSGIYNYFTEIPSKSLLTYFVVGLLLFFTINEIKFTGKHIVIIIICGMSLFYLNEKRRSTSLTRMQEIELKLLSIFPQPKFFYLDSGLVELLHSIKEYKQYNPLAFNKLIRILDDFLELTLDIEKNVDNAIPLYEILQGFKTSALNNLHSMIYNTPSDIRAEVKLDDAIESLHYILNFHLEKIRIKSNEKYKKDGPSIHNKYINNPSVHPDARDEEWNDRFDLY